MKQTSPIKKAVNRIRRDYRLRFKHDFDTPLVHMLINIKSHFGNRFSNQRDLYKIFYKILAGLKGKEREYGVKRGIMESYPLGYSEPSHIRISRGCRTIVFNGKCISDESHLDDLPF